MSAPCFDIQRDWDSAGLEGWPKGFDTRYLLGRIAELAVETTAEGATGPVLEVAAAEALHACRLSLRGLETFVVEPSWAMLARARAHRAELGARVTLIRGIAETLPFRAGTFDRVAFHVPALADYVFTIWRPRPRLALPRDDTRVRAVDPAYQWKIRAEAQHWTTFFNPGLHGAFRAAGRLANARYSGSPDRSWLDELAGRGPFGTGAVLGCDAGGYEAAWVARGASQQLD